MRLMLRGDEALNHKKIDGENHKSSVTHWGVSCHACQARPIVGIRYRSKESPNDNVCEDCINIYPDDALVAIHTPILPKNNEAIDLLRQEEAYICKQKKQQKDQNAREALLLAKVDPQDAAALEIV